MNFEDLYEETKKDISSSLLRSALKEAYSAGISYGRISRDNEMAEVSYEFWEETFFGRPNEQKGTIK